MSTESCRVWRTNNPLKYTYNNLKGSAKRRNIYFDISISYFEKFVSENNYLYKKGRSALSLTIDRKNPKIGYIEGNIRVLPLLINASRKILDDDFDWTSIMNDPDIPVRNDKTDLPF